MFPKVRSLDQSAEMAPGKVLSSKILARITRPTEGGADLKGRVGSLLEVGTGFHPELTGRENVYLSGAILGMRKKEIARKFDEIISFAETERFLDTPLETLTALACKCAWRLPSRRIWNLKFCLWMRFLR